MNDIPNSARTALVPEFMFRCGRISPIVYASFLTLSAFTVDCIVVPELFRASTLWALAALFALVIRRGTSGAENELPGTCALARNRILLFCGLHALLLSVLLFANPALPTAMKFAVLLPTLALFPLKSWLIQLRAYRMEFLAALIVMITFFPSRFFNMIMPWYPDLLGHLVYRVVSIFVNGLTYVAGTQPVIGGPKLDVEIIYDCTGIEGVNLFDCLFALIMIAEWNRLNKLRAALCYVAGLASILAGNVLRIILFVLLANTVAPVIGAGRFHIHAGWVFFALIFVGFLAATYKWMLQSPSSSLIPS
jgi:exosortase/archaeosortase family protein